MMQVRNLEKFLAWVKSSPCQFTVSSMSGGYVHVKFLVPCDKAIARTRCYNTLELTPRDQWHREVKEAGAIEDAIEDRDALINKCYEDGFRDGRREYADVEGIELPEFYLNELDKPVRPVKENSK